MHFEVMWPWSRMEIETDGEPRDARIEEGVEEGDCEEMSEMREGKISMIFKFSFVQLGDTITWSPFKLRYLGISLYIPLSFSAIRQAAPLPLLQTLF